MENFKDPNNFPTGIYAMIDLYGQCVQISVYDEDYRGSQVMSVPAEQATTDAVPVTTEAGATSMPSYKKTP